MPKILPGISDTNIYFLLSLRNTCQVDKAYFLFKQAKKHKDKNENCHLFCK